MDYILQRSARKYLTVTLDNQGSVLVKAPLRMAVSRIKQFLDTHRVKIYNMQQRYNHKTVLSVDMLQKDFGIFKVKKILLERFEIIQMQAKAFGLTTSFPVKFKILKSKWGSCCSNKQITLNLFLGLLPIALIDAVIAHEFCHLQEMNHSKRFYDLLIKLYPDYKAQHIQMKRFVICK